MPTINGATVVSGSGYTTIGNGGRKLVRLDNGNLYSVMKNSTSYFIQKSTDGTNWSSFKTATYTTVQDVCLSTNGKYIYMAISFNNSSFGVIGFDESGNVVSSVSVDNANQTALGNVSLAINETKTELHAAWASKNSTYPNSFNIRYAKGTINADGTVTWGTVLQLKIDNATGTNTTNPTIVVRSNGLPVIIADYNNSESNRIWCSTFTSSTTFSNGFIYTNNDYIQSSPSAIFVPQSINGLANGLIANAWMGKDATSNDEYYIHFSKSIDDGITWSTPSKLYLGSYPSITASKNGKLFITYVEDGATKYIESADNGDSWSTPTRIGTGTYPSSLIDFNINISVPLTIRRTVNEVFFSGSWSVETISPPVGERGQILNRQNILTYNITSDSTIGTVTEKINGVVVGTKTLTSGQNTTVNITQAQWDAIPYGKYRNNSAGRNTIEIVTPNNTFTYTFEKWFDNTLDVISATKAVKDSKDYYLPSAKKILSDAINSKGGSTTPTDSIENMASQIFSSDSKRSAEGTIVSSTTTKTFTLYNGSTSNLSYITIDTSMLGFKPNLIKIVKTDKTHSSMFVWNSEDFYVSGSNEANYQYGGSAIRLPFTNGSMDFPVNIANTSYDWIAYS